MGDAKRKRLSAASSPRLLEATKRLREYLPGDSDFGDSLSTAGTHPMQVVGRRLSDLDPDRSGLAREVGLAACQVWQGLSEAQGRGRGHEDLAILFTDLVGFSEWALEVGDDQAVDLLRQVGNAVEPAVKRSGGQVVKRMGDGLMAVFKSPQAAVDAAHVARDAVAAVDVHGYQPQIRAGVHVGRPRKLGGDYFGVDVNIAARVGAAAGPGEVLVSGNALAMLDADTIDPRKRWRFRAKGTPDDLSLYAVEPKVPTH